MSHERVDEATRVLAGRTIWQVAEWLATHDAGEPYEIYRNVDGTGGGYRLTVESLPVTVPLCPGCGAPLDEDHIGSCYGLT